MEKKKKTVVKPSRYQNFSKDSSGKIKIICGVNY